MMNHVWTIFWIAVIAGLIVLVSTFPNALLIFAGLLMFMITYFFIYTTVKDIREDDDDLSA